MSAPPALIPPAPDGASAADGLAGRQEARVRQAIGQEQTDSLRLAFLLRLGALAPVALYMALVAPQPVILVGVAALAGLGWLQYRLARRGVASPAVMALFPVADAIIAVGLLLAPVGLTAGLPRTLVQFSHPFPWLLLLLILYNLAYRPWLAAWGGIVMGLAWVGAMAWLLAAPEAYGPWDAHGRHGDMSDPQALVALLTDVRFVDVEAWLREAVILMIVGVLMAIMVKRSQDLIRRAVRAERARANLARYFSPGMVDLLAGHDVPFQRPRGGDAAVLFVDIVGFTRLAAAVPPEQVIELLRAFHRRMAETVFSNGGTLDKYIGDAAMATFGTPQPGPRDATNALACALAMGERLAGWNADRQARGLAPIRVGIGAHYGPVVIGDIGDERRLEFAVLGDTVNLASRLEDLTRRLDVEIVVSDALVRAALAEGSRADGLIAGFAAATTLDLPGVDRAVPVWVRPRLAPAPDIPAAAAAPARVVAG